MMQRLTIICLSSVLVSSCLKATSTGDTIDVGDDSGGGDPGPTCATTVTQTQPVNGATDHYYRDPIVFELSEPDASAVVLTDMAGSTTVSEDGIMVTFTPDVPLEPATAYTVGIDYCYGSPEISFSTSAYGASLEASTDLEGAVFSLSFSAGDFTIGDNAGELMGAVFTRPVLIQLQDTDGPYMDIVAAVGKAGVSPVEQDTCARTLRISHVSNDILPYIDGRAEDQEFGAHGGLLRFDTFEFSGTIAADGLSIGGIAYAAVLGVDEMVALLPEFGDEDALCLLASNLQIPCEPCGTDDSKSCIQIAAEHIPAVIAGGSVVEIDTAGTHHDCELDED
jgi:hypothetical protein